MSATKLNLVDQVQGQLPPSLYLQGAVVNRVASTTSTVTATSTAMNPFGTVTNTSGIELLTATITPKASTNILVIRFSAHFAMAAAQSMSSAIFINSSSTPISVAMSCYTAVPANAYYIHSNFAQVAAGGTSALVIRVRVGPSASTGYINADYNGGAYGANAMPAMLEVLEVAA